MRNDFKELDIESVVLITGGAGFIGFHLAKHLLDKGLRIIAYDNLNDYYDVKLKMDRLDILKEYDKFEFVKGDIADKEMLLKLFNKYKFDIVVNLAAQAGVRYSIDNPDAYIMSNIVGFFNVLECCRYNEVKHLVYASSSSVYGANKSVPFSTKDNVDYPVSLYAATKKSDELMAYSYCKLYGIKATGLRFFTVYGPYGRPDMAYYHFADNIMNDKPIKVYNNGDMYRDFTYIDDVVDAVARLLNNPPHEDDNGAAYKIYNVGNSTPKMLMDYIETLEKCLGKKGIKEYYPMQPGDVYRTYADVTELENDIGYKPDTDIQEGLSKFTLWYKEYYNLD